MLKQIELRNFKCYASATVPFGALTVFSGANGVGKSTVLQALLLMRQQLLGRGVQVGTPVVLNGSQVKLGAALDAIPSFLTGHDDQTIELSAGFDSGDVSFKFTCAEKDEQGRNLMVADFSATTDELQSEAFAHLPSDRIGPQLSYAIPELGESVNLYGERGEFAAYWLDRYASKPLDNKILGEQVGTPEDKSLSGCLNACLEPIHPGTLVKTQSYVSTGRVSLSYSFWNGQVWSRDYLAVNVGFGLTYLLPVYVALLRARPGEMVIVENPEVHLHPKAQTAVGRFMARVAATGVQVVVETHSDHVLNGIRLAVKEGLVRSDSVALHYVTNDDSSAGAQIVAPHILPSGRIDVWPTGFFDEYESAQMRLF